MCWQSGCCAEEEVGSAAQTVAQSAKCCCSNSTTKCLVLLIKHLAQNYVLLLRQQHIKLCATAQTVVDIGSAAQTGEREASALHHR